MTNNLWELNASVIPGFSFGKRVEFSNIYAAAGLGVLLSLDGLGGGVYTSVGFDSSINSRNLLGLPSISNRLVLVAMAESCLTR